MSDEMDFLTLDQLCSVCALERDWLVLRVREGLIPAVGDDDARSDHTTWRFTTTALARVRRMHEIELSYDAAPELAALVADMLEEIDALRARVRRSGL